jgi:hypothetical protein
LNQWNRHGEKFSEDNFARPQFCDEEKNQRSIAFFVGDRSGSDAHAGDKTVTEANQRQKIEYTPPIGAAGVLKQKKERGQKSQDRTNESSHRGAWPSRFPSQFPLQNQLHPDLEVYRFSPIRQPLNIRTETDAF